MRFLSAWALVLLAMPVWTQQDELGAKSARGREAMASGRFAEAAVIYAELVKALPDNPGLLLNLGMARHMAGQHRQAIAPFQAAVKLEPALLPAWLFLGASHLKLEETAKAIAPLEKVVALQTDHKEARQMLADALFSLDRFEPAAEHYRQLAELDPQNPRFWYGAGKSCELLSRRAFSELEKIAPESPYWLALAAGTRMAQQQYSGAFFFYRQALEKMPNLRGLHAAIAEIYKRTTHPDWAAIEEEKERKLGPPDCKSAKVECEFARRRYREVLAGTAGQKTAETFYWRSLAYNELALEAFTRLAQLGPTAEMHQLMAEAHRNQGRHQEAVKEWREALKFSPHNPDIQRDLAISLHQSRDYDGAQALLRDLLKRHPNSAELNFLIGDSLLNSQQAEKAIPFLKKSVQSDPNVLATQASLARALMQIGQAAQAIPHLQAALPIDDDGSLHYQLARACQSTGQQELAREALQKYQQIVKSEREQRQKLEQEMKITPP